MIHPSYYELMEKINKDHENEDTPVITSRYSIVLATSKRARQLTNGAKPKVDNPSPKLLSVAVDELYQGLVNIVGDEENEDTAPVSDAAGEAAEGAGENIEGTEQGTEDAAEEAE